MAARLLSIYLQDHFAGASAGVSLARRVAQSNGETPAADSLREVAAEVAEDRETLKRLMHDLGINPSLTKTIAAWLGERAARLKPNGRIGGTKAFHRLHELELLSLGIGGKIALWESLRVARIESAVDLDALIDRARNQRECVEQQRLALAREALMRNVV
ncbi:MAG: hypothetical protein QOK36_1587 [Gaiellales bacterium]|nr:hypothetical protein [Gaiellales bacterium]